MPAQILDPFKQIHPGQFISQYSDWILVTLLIFFFWSVVGIALHQRFKESRHLRFLITSVALFLAIGTYYSVYKGWLHFSLQGLGLFGLILLFVVTFFILYGLVRGYGMSVFNALPLSYALLYIGLWAISPNIFDNVAEIFPLGNFILLILFFIAIVKSVTAFFHHSKSPLDPKSFKDISFKPVDNTEIDREIREDHKEGKQIKNKTLQQTQNDIKTIGDIESYLKNIIQILRSNGDQLNQQHKTQIVSSIRHIGRNMGLLKNGLDLIRTHVSAYKNIHKRDIGELKKRLADAKTDRQRKLIEKELQYQSKMPQIEDYLVRYESKVIDFTKTFDRLLYEAFQKMKGNYPPDALTYLEYGLKNLLEMKHIYEKQKEIEKYLLKLNKKTIKDLKKEKDQ